jgi:thioredoxin reductase (NADPH)
MAKPTILTVDDDPAVSQAVARDLRRQYGAEYRIVRATSGAEALEALEQLVLRGRPVALIASDQRMPVMTGVEFLDRAREHAPEAKLVLLTAYADTEVAITAINEIGLDHYLLKPWDPPEERLYPVIDDLLEDWNRNHPGPVKRSWPSACPSDRPGDGPIHRSARINPVRTEPNGADRLRSSPRRP